MKFPSLKIITTAIAATLLILLFYFPWLQLEVAQYPLYALPVLAKEYFIEPLFYQMSFSVFLLPITGIYIVAGLIFNVHFLFRPFLIGAFIVSLLTSSLIIYFQITGALNISILPAAIIVVAINLFLIFSWWKRDKMT